MMANVNEKSLSEQQKIIEKAIRTKNLFECLPQYKTFNADEQYNLYCRTKADMDPKILKWAFKLAEKNVGPFYRELSMGWQPKVKQNDLNKNWARYLVAEDNNRKPVAYAMFRFDMDYGYSVLYCYEMQIEPLHHRRGLGKFMMTALESCARCWHMEKVVLTVLKNNPNAVLFFKALGYTLDESSPDVLEQAEYEILSKEIY